MLKNLFEFLSGAISIYMFLIIIRIIMTWFSPQNANDPRSVLLKLCDPYLNFFKRMGFVFGHVDFSPIIAITVLVIAGNILTQFSVYGKITFGILLSVIIKALWSAAGSLIVFIIIIVVIRLLILFLKPNTFSPILSSIDSMLVPMAAKAASLFMKSSVTTFQTNLMVFGALLIGVYYVANFAVNVLTGIFINIPF